MKRLGALLGATTLIFAASTFHYACLLTRERARHAPAPVIGAQSPRASSIPPAGPNPIELDTAAEPRKDSASITGAPKRDPGQIAVARHRLDQLRDPVARAERARSIASLLREDWRSIASHIGLSAAELERVIAELTEQDLQFQQRQAGCQIDPTCDAAAFTTAYWTSRDDRTAIILGPETYARFKTYQESGEERSLVDYLNRQLPSANTLSEATADKLVQVLGEQRRQFTQDAGARGEKVEFYGDFIGIRSAAAADTADESARRKESATGYVNHAVEIAAGVLNREQLARFKELLEQRLESYSDQVQRREIFNAEKKAAGGP